jgi:ribonuclease P protein component
MFAAMQRYLRLRRQDDFRRLRSAGRVWRHPLVILSMMPNGLPHNRYGFVVSKQLGKAVVRNRIRRRLREAVRHAHPDLAPGYDMALIARGPVVGQSYQAISEAVMSVFQQAGLWTSSPGELER